MYDVIIVGAGPAGSTAAKILAEKGFGVLLIEKFKIPRYKSCSGILIKKTLTLIDRYFGESVPESVMCEPAENKGMIFTNDKGKEYRFEQEGRNIWRSSFDYWLVRKAEESGAVVRDDTIAVSCEEKGNFVSVRLHGKKADIKSDTQTYTEEARYLLDCEGVACVLKQKIMKSVPAYITTYQTFQSGTIDLDPHYFYAYLQPELSEYDAWFNVKDDLLVLGVAVKDTGKIRHFYNGFLDYMKRYHNLKIEEQIKSEKWLMPQIRPGCQIDYGVRHVFFAGETAGFLNPMGEGISAAMESGYQAACAIADHFDYLDQVYAAYGQSTENMRSYMQRQWSLTGEMAETFQEMK